MNYVQSEAALENAKMIYEKFKHLTESQAIDERFWTWLNFQIGKKYLINRWGLDNVKKYNIVGFFSWNTVGLCSIMVFQDCGGMHI